MSGISAKTVRVQPQELAKHAYQTHSSPGAVQISVQSARAVLQGNSARAVGALSLETARHVRTEPSSNTKESWLATAAAVPRANFGHHVVTHMQKNAGSALPERSRLPSTHLGVWRATSVRLGSSAQGAGEQARGHAPPVLQMERPPLERRRMCSARGVGAAALPVAPPASSFACAVRLAVLMLLLRARPAARGVRCIRLRHVRSMPARSVADAPACAWLHVHFAHLAFGNAARLMLTSYPCPLSADPLPRSDSACPANAVDPQPHRQMHLSNRCKHSHGFRVCSVMRRARQSDAFPVADASADAMTSLNQALSNQTTGLNRAKFAIHVGQKRTAAVVAGSFLGRPPILSYAVSMKCPVLASGATVLCGRYAMSSTDSGHTATRSCEAALVTLRAVARSATPLPAMVEMMSRFQTLVPCRKRC